VSNWQILGVVLLLVGVTILALLSGFIVTFLETLLKLVAVFVGIVLIVVGAALLVGWRWTRGGSRRWGSQISST
jgi:uncharacterized membrane protein HdeD (DUF308 family)